MAIESFLPIPNIFDAKRVLCIQPHYDDNDIAAAGTLALLRQNGAELFYLTATDDLMGVVDHSLTDEDAGEYNYFDLRRDFLKYIRLLKPDFVFAPDAWLTYEAHRDHVQTGLAAAEAVMLAGLRKLAARILPPRGSRSSRQCVVTERSSTPPAWTSWSSPSI